MKMRVMYRRTRVTVDAERTGVCAICGREGKTDFHHYKYAYPTKHVRKFPQLALENTAELCFHCHMIADAVRNIADNPEKAGKIINRMMKKETATVIFKGAAT